MNTTNTITDPLGPSTILPGRVVAAQKALSALTCAVGPMTEDAQRALTQLKDALAAQGFQLRTPRFTA